MKQYDVPLDCYLGDLHKSAQQSETNVDFQHDVLKYITDIGSSLRLHMDIDALLKRVSEAACKALRFRCSVLYLSDSSGYFRTCATSGVSAEDEEYHRQHPVPESVVAQLISEEYRLSESYFIPAEASLWQDEYVGSFFLVDEDSTSTLPGSDPFIPCDVCWRPDDMLVVPLVSGDNALLGLLVPDTPLDGMRPTLETMALLELFANQAAVVIEGARLYEEAKRSSEERAALIEIGRALSAPEALQDLQTVYQTIYDQVGKVMPIDAFIVSRYYLSSDTLKMVYFVDEGVIYPPLESMVIRPQTREILLHDKVGRLFPTPQEYARFIEADPVETGEVAGNGRVSQAFMLVPIRYAEEPIGMFSVHSYQPYAYTQRHLELLKEIAVQAGIAITSAHLNTKLREALKQTQESERLKNHFLMTASHELRTPLTAIQGYLELLGNFGSVLDDSSKNRFVNNARRACEELVLLLGNVMDTSRVDQDRVSLNLGAVKLINTVHLILEILEPTITREGRLVDVKIADDLTIWADDLRMRQILLNVVGNALKYSPPTSGIEISAVRVDHVELQRSISSANQHYSISSAEQSVVLAIRDHGPGIQLEDQPHLFTKFMRLENAMNSLQRGAGLGLYLCRQLTEAMGGYIWVESNGIPGEGATFLIALPLCKNEL